MAEILKEWLTQRLQTSINWEAEEFGTKMKDGYIIANLLHSYNVVNDDKLYLIRVSNDKSDIKNNWTLIKEWLRDIEINLTDDDLGNIVLGKGSTLLRLFYQLFLQLDIKDRTDFIKRERKMMSSLVEKIDNRFAVHKVLEEKESTIDSLSKPLLNEKHFIEWQKNKAKKVKDTYDYIRHKYKKMLYKTKESKPAITNLGTKTKQMYIHDKKEMDEFSMRYPCKYENFTYEDLIELEQKAIERKKSLVNSDWAKNYMDNLCTRMNKKSDSEEFQKQIMHVVSGSLWDISVAEEESKLDSDLAKKVMKLSQFEKQMCTTIMETKQQGRNLVKNRILAEAEFAEERAQQFNKFLDIMKEEIHLGLVEIDFEKQRQNMLHKKLYAAKTKRKRQHYYEICYDTILSIIDYATKYAYFKRLLGDEVPSHFIHEWKILYYKQQAIFDILDPIENIIKEPGKEEKPTPKEEEIIRLELERQGALNDGEFLEYQNYLYPWCLDLLLPNYDSESEDRKFEYLGARILGHVVYTLLEMKYPYPPQRVPADLPVFTSKALLRGLPDCSIIQAMQTLLDAQKIFVVRLESAINFCLRQFKKEMVGCTDIELSFDKFISTTHEEDVKDLIRSMKAEDEIVTKSNDVNISQLLGPLTANTKQTQTPKTIPEEQIILSSPADLGRYAYNALNSGDSLTDHLLAAMLVEYVKDQEDINGFVIINYPNSFREAQILEETFSGNAPPDEGELDDRDDIYLEESISKHRKKEKDQFKDVRYSKLVSDPHKKRLETPFKSYFTCYFNLLETEDILQEFMIWDLTLENSDFIDRFYAALGINYSMYFEIIEKDQLALICKYIIGDYTMPIKSNDTLFGENVLSTLDFPSSDDKRTKSKIVKPETSNGKSKERLRRTTKFSKMSITDLEVVKADFTQDVQYETILYENIEGDRIESKISRIDSNVEEVKLLPGEEDWDYGELPIPDVIGTALASCWEAIEKTYIHDMQQLLLCKRIQMNCLVPFTRFMKDKMDQIITLPSCKQDLVSRFQKEYNDFENDWRDVNLTKNEWHCRVKELQNMLYKICDERKQYAEQQRNSLIYENWALEELITLANTYISCMQTELNQFILSYQIFHDFYFSMIKHAPPNDRLSLKGLNKIYKETDETSGSKKGGEDKLYKQLKSAFLDLQLRNIEIDYSNNPLNMVIENNVKFSLKVIKEMNELYRSLITHEYSEIAKIVPLTRKKENNSEESVNSEEIFKLNALKCIDEWLMGINGEMFRCNLRLLALQYKCYQDMKLFNGLMYKSFTEIQEDINNYYLNEIKSVDRLCKYLQMAIEAGNKIPENLLLEHDTFVIDPNLLQFSVIEKKSTFEKVIEVFGEIDFQIGQLARLRSQLKIMAPTGIALQQAFIYSLQDFIFFGKESCEGSLFPEIWRRVDPEQIPKLVFLIFGETVYIDWRDFLIYCLNIRFPRVDELLELRKTFRCYDLDSTELISRDDFLNTQLWFEQDYDLEDKRLKLKITLMKHLLFELFETDTGIMNYSAFLLAFCKSIDPKEGFAMALSMAVGKKICYSLDECEEVICKLLKEKKYRDECLVCALKCANQFLDKVIMNVVNICDGTTITEVKYTEPLTDKKAKKSKISTRAKKIESSQSARLPKMQKSLTSRIKIAQSETDIKTTFICKPCEEEVDTIQEKSVDKEEVEEEQKVESQPDPNLVYAVKQSVIWNVLRICLPWHFQLHPDSRVSPYVENLTNVLKRLEVETDEKDIYISRFVVDPGICKLLNKTRKFVAINIPKEILKVTM